LDHQTTARVEVLPGIESEEVTMSDDDGITSGNETLDIIAGEERELTFFRHTGDRFEVSGMRGRGKEREREGKSRKKRESYGGEG
jgi:hypothetical protein